MREIINAIRRRGRVLAVGLLALTLMFPGTTLGASHVSTVAEFDPGFGQFPEGIASSKTGTLYVSWILSDQIAAITPDGDVSVAAQLPAGAGPAGMVVAPNGVVYVAASGLDLTTGETDPTVRGVYKFAPGQTPQRISGSEAMIFPNDVTMDHNGDVYATDTITGTVWRIPKHGEPELWASGPLLEGTGAFGFGFPIGANGIAIDHKTVIVANPEKGLLASVPVEKDGTAGEMTLLAQSPLLIGADGITLDVHGDIYVVAGILNLVVAVRTDGSINILATEADGLNQPATLAFGSGQRNNQTLFITNFSIFAPIPTPGVLAMPADSPGKPVP